MRRAQVDELYLFLLLPNVGFAYYFTGKIFRITANEETKWSAHCWARQVVHHVFFWQSSLRNS